MIPSAVVCLNTFELIDKPLPSQPTSLIQPGPRSALSARLKSSENETDSAPLPVDVGGAEVPVPEAVSCVSAGGSGGGDARTDETIRTIDTRNTII